VRVDPALYTFRVHYLPGQPQNVSQWRDQIPSAVAFINANFFDSQGDALGLLISEGVVYSPAYIGFGGMFQIENGQPRIRSTIREPYAGEFLEQASQTFPMLILDGLPTYERVDGDRASRRTVIGQDAAGRIILLSTSSLIGMRLADLSAYLVETDLNLVTALNLDGGGSSLMAVNVPTAYTIPSFDPVPAVIAVYPREANS
jgi:exopolysaccharide biosynthesis protein